MDSSDAKIEKMILKILTSPCESYHEADSRNFNYCNHLEKCEECLIGFVPFGCFRYYRDNHFDFEKDDRDPYDCLVDEKPEIRFCFIDGQPVCLGINYEPFECLGNADKCKFNLNNPNNIESLLFVDLK